MSKYKLIKGFISNNDEGNLSLLESLEKFSKEISLYDAFKKAFSQLSLDVELTDIDDLNQSGTIKNVSISIYVSSKKLSYEDMIESQINEAIGLEYSEDWSGYSEFTINEFYFSELKVGNHDLNRILNNNIGKYVIIKIGQFKADMYT